MDANCEYIYECVAFAELSRTRVSCDVTIASCHVDALSGTRDCYCRADVTQTCGGKYSYNCLAFVETFSLSAVRSLVRSRCLCGASSCDGRIYLNYFITISNCAHVFFNCDVTIASCHMPTRQDRR